MEKTSKIFSQLKTNSEQQNEKIYQLHQQSLRNLEMKLTDSFNTKLNQIEQDLKNEYTLKIQTIENTNKQQQTKLVQKQKETITQLEKANFQSLMIYCCIVLVVGIIAGAILFQSKWIVPKEMRYTHKETNQKYIMSKKAEYSKDKKITFIKIGEE